MTFNQLSPAEAERLALLTEECAEVIHIVGKILRHGYNSFHPDDEDGLNNKEMLEVEISHVEAAVRMMRHAGDIDVDRIRSGRDQKLLDVKQYLHHQRT